MKRNKIIYSESERINKIEKMIRISILLVSVGIFFSGIFALLLMVDGQVSMKNRIFYIDDGLSD